MKIAITGASGTLGRPLVKAFQIRGAQLLLIGRDATKLRNLFPEAQCCSFDELAQHGRGFDGLLHLAVLNNNVSVSPDDFTRVNVVLTQTVLEAAQEAGIGRFVLASSIQALDDENRSAYAASKRMAADLVGAARGISTTILYFPAVIGEKLTGKLAMFGRLPSVLKRPMLKFYAAVTPVTDIEAVATESWQALTSPTYPREKIATRDQSENLAYGALKRSIDLVAAVIILILFFWLLALIWLVVRLQSPGPGIFAQARLGRNGEVFTCYKFRTMAEGAPNVATHESSLALVTPIGKILRRTKLDELPQAFNILLNQMSLVGPRPCLPSQDRVISERDKWGVLAVLPGITGLAQINHVDMSKPELLAKWDAQYVMSRSLRLDLGILLRTALGRGTGDAMTEKP